MPPVACLPWYDFAELRSAHDQLWARVARGLRTRGVRDVPAKLAWELPFEEAFRGELLFGQACGYDVRIAYAEQLRAVATPRYAAPGCDGPQYRSFVAVRGPSGYSHLADLRGARCAINTKSSHSGMNALRRLVAPLHSEGRFFAAVETSGGHEQSLALIARGEVDVAAIDCVTWALLERHRPGALTGLRVLHETPPAPAPPFVTSATTPPDTVERLRAALFEALDDPALAAIREGLLLSGADVLPRSAYDGLARQRDEALALGYRELPPDAEDRAEQ